MQEHGTSAGSISADMSAVLGTLSFWRITHVPFAAWLAALERWQLTGHGSGLRLGNSQLHGPAEHDPHFGTCQIEVRLAQRPNESTAWVPSADVSLATDAYYIVVDLTTTHLRLFKDAIPQPTDGAAT